MRIDLKALLITALAVTACMASIGCRKDPNTAQQVIIGNGDEYQKVLRDAVNFSKEPLLRRSKGETLTEADREALTKAVPLFQSLINFDPGQFAPHLALGQIFLEFDDPAKANDHLLYCLGNLEQLTKKDDPGLKLMEAECRYELSNARFKVGNYVDAVTEVDKALAISKENPNYYVARAAAYSELKRYAEAKVDLERALKLDPTHKRANSLLKLFNSAPVS